LQYAWFPSANRDLETSPLRGDQCHYRFFLEDRATRIVVLIVIVVVVIVLVVIVVVATDFSIAHDGIQDDPTVPLALQVVVRRPEQHVQSTLVVHPQVVLEVRLIQSERCLVDVRSGSHLYVWQALRKGVSASEVLGNPVDEIPHRIADDVGLVPRVFVLPSRVDEGTIAGPDEAIELRVVIEDSSAGKSSWLTRALQRQPHQYPPYERSSTRCRKYSSILLLTSSGEARSIQCRPQSGLDGGILCAVLRHGDKCVDVLRRWGGVTCPPLTGSLG
jgi:hypothetical protein